MAFKHMMVDLETMGTKPNSSIMSIGAVEFDIETGETGKEFYRVISLDSCFRLGLGVCASTLTWWMLQGELARKSVAEVKGVDIREALLDFSDFCNDTYEVWGNSARFDLGILENAYDRLGIEVCWDFRKERCVRTLVGLNPIHKRAHVPFGVSHMALDDCYNQIVYCTKTWQSLNNRQPAQA